MNQDASGLPRSWNQFPLFPGDRAGVRVSVKHIIPSTSTCIMVRYHPPLPVRVRVERKRVDHKPCPAYTNKLVFTNFVASINP